MHLIGTAAVWLLLAIVFFTFGALGCILSYQIIRARDKRDVVRPAWPVEAALALSLWGAWWVFSLFGLPTGWLQVILLLLVVDTLLLFIYGIALVHRRPRRPSPDNESPSDEEVRVFMEDHEYFSAECSVCGELETHVNHHRGRQARYHL